MAVAAESELRVEPSLEEARALAAERGTPREVIRTLRW